MSYQKENVKKTYNGTGKIPLTVEVELIEIREQVEDMTNLQKGSELALVHQAYKEILNAQGLQAMKLKPSCSGCTMTMKKLVSNWFKTYDEYSNPPLIIETPLKHLETKETYEAMLERFNTVATDEEKQTINEGKRPSKKQINEYFKTKEKNK